jgi:glycosyltransferase involved in cell wall biosynthesis
MPTLSVIVPVHNVENYLGECLESLITQTLTDLEIIVVNDATTDNSEDVIRSYMAKDCRIRYYHHETNRGPGGARNTGVRQSQGDWITFVDADDWLATNCLEHTMQIVNETLCDCIMFGASRVSDTGEQLPNASYLRVTPSSNIRRLIAGRAISPANIFRKSDIQDIEFPENIKHEDDAFWFKYIVSITPRIACDSTRYYHYRARPGSIMTDTSTSRLDLVYVIQDIYNFMSKRGLLDQYGKLFLTRSNRFCRLAIRSISGEHLEQFTAILRNFFLNSSMRNHNISHHLFLSVCLLEDKLVRSHFTAELVSLYSLRTYEMSTLGKIYLKLRRWGIHIQLLQYKYFRS